jgi:hypothetical protein
MWGGIGLLLRALRGWGELVAAFSGGGGVWPTGTSGSDARCAGAHTVLSEKAQVMHPQGLAPAYNQAEPCHSEADVLTYAPYS